ncbi:MAG TPA: hypothetical protein DCL54_18155, partial [Alphaproteobacteria bacterium]|nr:hypothetical protein [Alphaproteobacteria bacterium]
AERVSAARFRYRGKVEGANTPALEGVPTMDCQNNLYWVSPRSYDKTLSTIYRGTFAQGRVTNVELVEGVSRKTAGIVNFDVEVSPSGNELYIVDGLFNALGGPNSADIAYAVRANSGFRRPEDASSLFAKINTSALEYAMAISHDGLELFFTRMSGALFWRKLTIEHSVRASTTAQWEPSRPIASIDGFVEGPTITADGKTLYFHKKVDGMFRLFMVTRP